MKLLIGTPLRFGASGEFLGALLGLLRSALPQHEIEFTAVGGGCVNMARNDLAYMAVSGGFDALLQIDEDLHWGVRHVERIVGLEVDVVSGLYCKRKPGTPEWLFIPKPGAEPKDGMIECSGLPTGFLFTTTRVLKDIAADNPQLAFDYKEDSQVRLDGTRTEWFPMGVVGRNTDAAKLHQISALIGNSTDQQARSNDLGLANDFMDSVQLIVCDVANGNNRWLGEDYGFSRLARKSGFSLWQDLGGEIIRHGPAPGFPITEDAVGYRAGQPFLMPPALDI